MRYACPTKPTNRQPGALGNEFERHHGPVENFSASNSVEVSDSSPRVGSGLGFRLLFGRINCWVAYYKEEEEQQQQQKHLLRLDAYSRLDEMASNS